MLVCVPVCVKGQLLVCMCACVSVSVCVKEHLLAWVCVSVCVKGLAWSLDTHTYHFKIKGTISNESLVTKLSFENVPFSLKRYLVTTCRQFEEVPSNYMPSN